MVILIGGAPCTGKTLMAQKLLEKYQMPYISVDHLKMGFVRGNESCGFTPLDGVETIAKILWPFIKGIIMTSIENSQQLIIEGIYIFPQYVEELDKEYLNDIISFYIGFSEKYIKERYESGIIKNRNAIEGRGPDKESMEWLITRHKEAKRLCNKPGEVYFEIENDYAKETQTVYDWVDRKIKGI